MELNFKSEINRREDISLYDFNKIIDKSFDTINAIEVIIDWSAVIYTKSYGITSSFPVIRRVTLDMNYDYISKPESRDENGDLIYEEYDDKDYSIVLDDFDIWQNKENERKPYKERKWVVYIEYNKRDSDDTHLFPTAVDIDFETKRIDLEF